MLGAHLNGAQRPRLAPVNGIGRSARPQKAAWRSVAVSKPARRTPPLAAIAEPLQMKVESPDTVLKCVRALQFLAVDATNTAGSGHPGAPMALAPAAYILWNEYMKFNPKNPGLFNRDRFVLSNGHASMLQYGLLHLFGSDVFTLDQLKQLRMWGSVTPGHPERQVADGIEVTTGPLGQGVANAVGLAAAEAHLAAQFNKPDAPKVFDNYTYCFLGDGCMMEGICQEACSLAGHWGLGKLICIYDDNSISIDGETSVTFTEDTTKRFEALNWHVVEVKDGNHDMDAIRKAIEEGQKETARPTMIRLVTTIGYGSPNMAGTPGVHGAALGEEEAKLTREKLEWSYGEWEVPDEVYKAMRDPKIELGKQMEQQRNEDFAKYKEKYPSEADEIENIEKGGLKEGWEEALEGIEFETGAGDATRKHSNKILNTLTKAVPTFFGGSADLASSNKTYLDEGGDFEKGNYAGRNFRFGVREHGMAGICNGLAAYAPGVVPFASTFTIFTDYMRASMRLSALSKNRVVYVTTHDSIGLGGDGPTHQSVEQLAGFRAMPNMPVIRPAGGRETVGAYKVALSRAEGPTLLALSRQSMNEHAGTSADGVQKGGYICLDSDGPPSHILIGTGSELDLCIDAAEMLKKDGSNPRVVSMPCMELYMSQSNEYKESVLPKDCRKRVSVEALSTLGWREIVTDDGVMLGMHEFGASAPGDVMMEKFGFTAEKVADAARKL